MVGKEGLLRGDPLCRHHWERQCFFGGSEPAQGWSTEPHSCLSSDRGLAGDGAACIWKRGATPALGGTAPPSLETTACVSE